MAQILKQRRSAVEGKVPTTSDLSPGELAINTYDGRIFFEKNGGSAEITQILTANSQTTGSLELVGHITASGNISGSLTSTGSFGYLNISDNAVIGGAITITDFSNATHTRANAAGGGQITLGTGTTGNYVATNV
ncbi:hypothetical protein CL614_09750, partial [archaeon]|nr:hypothetical protein [archaeon]